MAWSQRVFDTFSDAAFTELTSHLPNVGSGYTDLKPSWRIALDGVSAEPGFVSGLTVNDTSLNGDQAAQVIVQNDRSMSVLARTTGTSLATWSGYAGRYNQVSGVLQLFRLDAGVETQLGTNVAFTYSANMVLRIECSGSSISVLVDGVTKITQSDATYASGKVGIYASSPTVSIDDFRAYEAVGRQFNMVRG